ncbi:MAG: PEP-CTERM sorting domain-containing protein [Fimbriimonadaceae bacterium]|nr:PEP-CTERM sorting domain-containing protein [Fimbriimonadaceae bacterium]
MRRVLWMVVVLVPGLVQAGPVVNGNFETGSLNPWVGSTDPAALRDPKVTNGAAGGGINGISGSKYDDFAVLDTTDPSGNISGQTWWSSITQTGVTLGGVTGTLQFKLTDPSDPTVPTGNQSGLLLDNIRVVNNNSLAWDWYALTKKDQARNDYYQVLFNHQELFRFNYTSSLMPTGNYGGGGGTNFGPFSYGTCWQSSTVTVPPVPEPATWMLLGLALLPVARARRRRR